MNPTTRRRTVAYLTCLVATIAVIVVITQAAASASVSWATSTSTLPDPDRPRWADPTVIVALGLVYGAWAWHALTARRDRRRDPVLTHLRGRVSRGVMHDGRCPANDDVPAAAKQHRDV